MLRRLLTLASAGLVVALTVLAAAVPAHAVATSTRAPDCPPVTVEESTKDARAVFSGIVTDVVKQERTDGQQGAFYQQTVTVDLVYQGKIDTEIVMVQTDRNLAQCSLGQLVTGSEYMFFVTGTGAPWFASGGSGTRVSDPTVVTEVEGVLGQGKPPVEPAPEKAVFTPVDTSEPQPLSRTAAPGAALLIVSLLSLALVAFVRRRP